MSEVQKAFNVVKTGGPGHFTVELPKPVTAAVVKAFNSLFF
jgi:thiamine pyrophosphate-dependent acetolactate synthase large subunit-like protein